MHCGFYFCAPYSPENTIIVLHLTCMCSVHVYTTLLTESRHGRCICVSAGLLVPHGGEVCRHSEGQGAAAATTAVGSADAAAEQRLCLGKFDRLDRPHPTVPGSKRPHPLGHAHHLYSQSLSPPVSSGSEPSLLSRRLAS